MDALQIEEAKPLQAFEFLDPDVGNGRAACQSEDADLPQFSNLYKGVVSDTS
jgi:hypothetical protein